MNTKQFENLKPEGIDEAVDRIRNLMRNLISTSIGFLLDNEDAATQIYQIITGRTTHRIVATRKTPFKLGDQEPAYYYEILAIDKYNIGHVLSIRFLQDTDDLEPMCGIVSGITWRYLDEDSELLFCDPQDYMMVYISYLDIMQKGKGVYRLGFHGVENELPYDAPFPTLLINTEVSEDSDASRLVRELLLVDYPAHQFEAVSKEIRSVQETIAQAFKDSDRMPANALIVFGIHENNDIPVEDVLRYLEIPAPFHTQLKNAVEGLIELDPYKKRT